MNTRRVAALHLERAEILSRLVAIDEELAAAFVEGDEAEQQRAPRATPRSRPVKQTQIVVPQRAQPLTDIDRARARAALRRVGYKA